MSHYTFEVTCPRCGVNLKDGFESPPIDMDKAVAALASGETVRVPIECSNCEASLFLYQEEDSEELEMHIWVKDR